MTFKVTGSATYLAASSLSDSSSIEANTYLRSLKPHVRAEWLHSFQTIVCSGAQPTAGAKMQALWTQPSGTVASVSLTGPTFPQTLVSSDRRQSDPNRITSPPP